MNYQLTILITNKLDEKARQSVLDSVSKEVGDKAKTELWGVRGLAYPIKHEEKAFYAHFNFEAEPATIPVIDRRMKLNEDIIRYLLIKIEEKDLPKAPVAEKKTIIKKAEKTEEVVEEKEEVSEATEETETPEESAK
jgi:ribosomal protein S6